MSNRVTKLEKLECDGPYGRLRSYMDTLLKEGADIRRVSKNDVLQCRFIAHILDGDSEKLAEMLALMRPPKCKTDREFLRGHCNGNQFEHVPGFGDLYKKRAEVAGVNVKGKVYLASLARYPGDPEAWVDGAGDAKRICETRGWECNGFVKVKAREPLDDYKHPGIAEDIVRERTLMEVARMEEQEPGSSAGVDLVEMGEAIKERHTPHWVK